MARTLPAPLTPLDLAGEDAATIPGLTRALRDAGVEPSAWSNGPGDRYGVHEHSFTKLLVCATGSITFLIGPDAVPVDLKPGDGFVLPPHTPHAAVVGPAGCTCLEGHR
jgi:mannose-6-phosphate isomerase-like protein (cupin superfamily)